MTGTCPICGEEKELSKRENITHPLCDECNAMADHFCEKVKVAAGGRLGKMVAKELSHGTSSPDSNRH